MKAAAKSKAKARKQNDFKTSSSEEQERNGCVSVYF